MKVDQPKIIPLSERALIVEFGTSISEELNIAAMGLADYLNRNPFPDFIKLLRRILRYVFGTIRSLASTSTKTIRHLI